MKTKTEKIETAPIQKRQFMHTYKNHITHFCKLVNKVSIEESIKEIQNLRKKAKK